MSTRKSPSGKKAGRPPKDPPKGSIGWHVRKAREKAGLEPGELAARVGIKGGMMSRGELYSNFSDSVLMLLAMELRNDFGEEWLKPYAQEGVVVEYYREMSPEIKELGLEMLQRLRAGEIIDASSVDEEDDEDGGDEE